MLSCFVRFRGSSELGSVGLLTVPVVSSNRDSNRSQVRVKKSWHFSVLPYVLNMPLTVNSQDGRIVRINKKDCNAVQVKSLFARQTY